MVKSVLFHRNLVLPKSPAKSEPRCEFFNHLIVQTQRIAVSGFSRFPLIRKFPPLSAEMFTTGDKISSFVAWTQESHSQVLDELPVSIELKSICSEDEFNKVIADAELRNEPVILVWMASWCRKCIYLKPKLEKLAADYHLRLQFYSVDVNMVSHKLVGQAGVTKMPTIQLWKDGKKQDEVIGGYKAYLVANEVQKMIESALACE